MCDFLLLSYASPFGTDRHKRTNRLQRGVWRGVLIRQGPIIVQGGPKNKPYWSVGGLLTFLAHPVHCRHKVSRWTDVRLRLHIANSPIKKMKVVSLKYIEINGAKTTTTTCYTFCKALHTVCVSSITSLVFTFERRMWISCSAKRRPTKHTVSYEAHNLLSDKHNKCSK